MMKRGRVKGNLAVEPVFVIQAAEFWISVQVEIARTNRDPSPRRIGYSRAHQLLVELRHVVPKVHFTEHANRKLWPYQPSCRHVCPQLEIFGGESLRGRANLQQRQRKHASNEIPTLSHPQAPISFAMQHCR